jgi:hypothetical protein
MARAIYLPHLGGPLRYAGVLSKLLALAFIVVAIGKLFFRPQLKAVGRWLDGVVNAALIAIALVYAIQLVIFLTAQ